MIERIIISNFKQLRAFDFKCNSKRNILIGENSSGKSTLLQAISLTLSGSFSQIDNIGILNLFNIQCINDFLQDLDIEKLQSTELFDKLPKLFIELYFDEKRIHNESSCNFQLEGTQNSLRAKCFGIKLQICPKDDKDSCQEMREILTRSQGTIFPFEFYKVEFTTFSGESYTSYTRPFKFLYSIINSSLVDTKSELQKRVSEIYDDSIHVDNQHKVNHKFRENSKNFIEELKQENLLHCDKEYSLEFDNSSSNALKSKITALKNNVDIRQIGQGEKVILSIENLYNRLSDRVQILLIEEPENHLSYLNMLKILNILDQERDVQVFIATHSNMIASRLGINNCLFLNKGRSLSIQSTESVKTIEVSEETVGFFQKSTNQNLLNFILSDSVILVEGNAEYILMEKFYEMVADNQAYLDNVYIISVGGLSFERYLEIAKNFPDKRVAVITDNDKDFQRKIKDKYSAYEKIDNIRVFADEIDENYTFEVCLFSENKGWLEKCKLTNKKGNDLRDFMLERKNKAECALKILNKLNKSHDGFIIPEYIREAILWVKKN